MSRWEPDARGRLETAALELFEQQGFAATTVPQIAERAGLTTRTFFRHFRDKREVLFANASDPAWLSATLDAVPDGLAPIDLVGALVRLVAEERFEGRREQVARIRAISASEPSLGERNLAKRHALSDTVCSALVDRGFDRIAARLLADLTATVLYLAVERWVGDPSGDRPLTAYVDEILDAHAELFAAARSGNH